MRTVQSLNAPAFGLEVAGRDTVPSTPLGAVTRLEAGRGRGLSGKGALIGAGVGLMIGGAVGLYLDDRQLSTHGPLLPLTATGGLIVGGLLGAGGGPALKGAGIGLLAGAAVGVVAGLASGDQNCEGCRGLAALGLGGAGAAAGVVIGAVVGIANQRDASHEGSEDRVRVSVAPYGSGVTVGAAVAF